MVLCFLSTYLESLLPTKKEKGAAVETSVVEESPIEQKSIDSVAVPVVPPSVPNSTDDATTTSVEEPSGDEVDSPSSVSEKTKKKSHKARTSSPWSNSVWPPPKK